MECEGNKNPSSQGGVPAIWISAKSARNIGNILEDRDTNAVTFGRKSFSYSFLHLWNRLLDENMLAASV